MAFRASLVIDGNASGGKAALEAAGTAARGAKGEIKDLGTAAKATADDMGKLTTAEARVVRDTRQLEAAQVATADGLTRVSAGTRRAMAEVVDFAEAQRRAGRESRALGESQAMAAGSVGTLVAQFNDVGMMLAAGQNPLMLAIQQGTQITQVIGPLGAAGAVRALGTAFVQMVSPLNLATLGIIAAGGFIVQWLTSSADQVKSLDDRLDELASSVEAFAKSSERATTPVKVLEAQFGTAAVKARQLLQDMAELDRRSAANSVKQTITGFSDDLRVNVPRFDTGDQARMADFLDLNIMFRESRIEINSVLTALGQLSQAPDLTAQIAAAERLRDSFEHAAQASGKMSQTEDAFLARINKLVSELYTLQGKDQGAEALSKADELSDKLARQVELQATIQKFGADSAEVANLRLAAERQVTEEMVKALGVSQELQAQLMAQWDAANRARDPFAERQAAAYRYYGETRRVAQEAEAEAQKLLASVSEENAIRAATLRYGEQSALVAQLRADKERQVLEQQIEQLDVSESIKDEIRAAISEGERLNATDMSGGISAAAEEARRMADEIMRAIGATRSLQQSAAEAVEDAKIRSETALDPIAQARKLGEARMRRTQGARRDGAEGGELESLEAEVRSYGDSEAERARLDQQTRSVVAADRKSQRGQRSGADRTQREAEREQERIDDLIGSLRAEIDVMNELDPVQQEMIRYREVLANATDQERETVQQLIVQRQAEAVATEGLRDATDLAGDSMYNFLDGVILKGASARSVIADLAGSLADALMQSALLGQGPLAGIFGTSAGGGLFGIALSALGLGAHAEGGQISGPGTGTSDSILARLSDGEYVINAASTAKHLPLIEAINADRLPAFAEGGRVASTSAPSWMRSSSETAGAAAPAGAVLEIRLAEGLTASLEGQMEGIAIRMTRQGLSEYDRKVLPGRVDKLNAKPKVR